MPRKTPTDAGPAPALVMPHVIDPNAVYSVDEARILLKLKASSIRREVRESRMKIARRCGRNYLLGRWILEWLETGQWQPRRRPAPEVAG